MISYTSYLNAASLHPLNKYTLKEHLGFYATDCLHFTQREQRNRADSLRRATRAQKEWDNFQSPFSARTKASGIYRQMGEWYQARINLVAAIDSVFE